MLIQATDMTYLIANDSAMQLRTTVYQLVSVSELVLRNGDAPAPSDAGKYVSHDKL